MLGCRTAQYGIFSLRCPQCDWQEYRPLSCGHRTCTQCHHHANALWAERQCLKLLPVPYFMVTFTLPRELHGLARRHPRTVYALLFEAAIETLRQFGCNDTRLQAELAATAVLHTHTRRLDYHPHVHLVVPGGGLDPEKRAWRKVNGKYLFNHFNHFNHFNLARVFRGSRQRNPAKRPASSLRAAGPWLRSPASSGRMRRAYRFIRDNGTSQSFGLQTAHREDKDRMTTSIFLKSA